MPSEFRQTSIALRSDRERGHRSLALIAAVGCLLLLVGLWSTVARVPLVAVSTRARLQARAGVHPVDAMVTGRVTAVHLPLGGTVRKGDVLMALDDTDVRLRLDEARAVERGLAGQIEALEAEIAAREEALASEELLGRASQSEARAMRDETVADARLARRERARADTMRRSGLVAQAEAERAVAAMARANAAASARGHRLSLLGSETRRDLADRRADNESLQRSLADLRARRDGAGALVERLRVERERHTVRAPIGGVLGQVHVPQVGSVVTTGKTMAVVTPETGLELAADFAPADAIGRVRPGQRGRMRVAGFPWPRYGMLGATVAAVSSEVSDGTIRVVLALDERGDSPIPYRHGLVGDVEIEIEEVSPATLIARAAGGLFERSEPP
jgi:multidrug resistance efflux pump